MLKITNLKARLADEDKLILKGVNLKINPGEVHVLQGRNGSGKSTLASVISGNPKFEITKGSIEIIYGKKKTKVEDMDVHERSLAGLFLANQYPLEIPGVNLSNFLRLAYNARQEKDLPVFKFRKLLKERAEVINYPEHLLDRNLNEGFSGGEKKKTEILQLALLEPKYAVLDETDSGLDKQAIEDVFVGLRNLKKELLPDLGLLIITHYEKVFDYIKPDFTHEMSEGVIV